MKAVRQYGLEGVRIQNVSEIAGISPGAIYRHFDSKEQLLTACFTDVDQQAAAIFEHLQFDPQAMLADPMAAVKGLWLPYFRFWTSRPDETVFYHRFRDSAFFPEYNKSRDVTYFKTGGGLFHRLCGDSPGLSGRFPQPEAHQSGSAVAPRPHIYRDVRQICGRGHPPQQPGDRGDGVPAVGHRTERLFEAGPPSGIASRGFPISHGGPRSFAGGFYAVLKVNVHLLRDAP